MLEVQKAFSYIIVISDFLRLDNLEDIFPALESIGIYAIRKTYTDYRTYCIHAVSVLEYDEEKILDTCAKVLEVIPTTDAILPTLAVGKHDTSAPRPTLH